MNYTKLILVWKINVGNLPAAKAKEFISELKKNFQDNANLPPHVKCCYIPIHSGETTVEMLPLENNVNIEEIENLLGNEKEQLINLRISKVEKSLMLRKAKDFGFKNLSEYLRFVALNTNIKCEN